MDESGTKSQVNIVELPSAAEVHELKALARMEAFYSLQIQQVQLQIARRKQQLAAHPKDESTQPSSDFHFTSRRAA